MLVGRLTNMFIIDENVFVVSFTHLSLDTLSLKKYYHNKSFPHLF